MDLAYAVERWGRPGLVVHGAMWGVWYAPLFILSSAATRDSLESASGFVVRDGSAGIRDAVFRWPGWPTLALVALIVLFVRPNRVETA